MNAPLYPFFLAMHRSGLFFLKALFLRAPRPGPPQFKDPIVAPFCLFFQTYFLRYLPSVGFLAFLVLSAGPCENKPSFRKFAAGFSFSPFQSISCTTEFGRLVPPPFRGSGRGSLPCPPGLGFWPHKASWIRFWRLGLPQEGPPGLEGYSFLRPFGVSWELLAY